MARPKAGTKEGEVASERWRQTMLKKHGADGVHKKMQEIGARGGRNSHNGGYASEKVGADGLTGRERARVAGAKGGRISRRTGIKNHEGKKWKKIQELNGEV